MLGTPRDHAAGDHGHQSAPFVSDDFGTHCCRGWTEKLPLRFAKNPIHPKDIREYHCGKKDPWILRYYSSKPEPGHPTGRAGRGEAWRGEAARRGGAGQGGTAAGRSGALGHDPSLSTSGAPKTSVLDFSSEAHLQLIIYSESKEKMSGWQSFDKRFNSGTTAALRPGYWPLDRRRVVFVNPSHAKHVRELCNTIISQLTSLSIDKYMEPLAIS